MRNVPTFDRPASSELVAFAFKHPETGKVNQAQCQFHDTVMLAVARKNNFRRFWYGGAIRGGKTFVTLFILVRLAKLFPKSRWHVFRADFPELEDTTIPSMEKLIGTEGMDFVWKRRSSSYHVRFANGSKIFFKSENLQKDPELNWMLGLETNGIVLEQMEGLSETLMDRAIERAGSWYIPNMPPPLIFGTFNPTHKWVKKKIYDKWRHGNLDPDEYFQEALPENNPFVTQDQWENWKKMDPITYNQLIKSQWVFKADGNLFAYSFDPEKHVVDTEDPAGAEVMTAKRALPVKLIFDFNVDPMTCIVTQHDGLRWIKVLHEYRLRDSDIFEVLTRIKTDWIIPGFFVVATGDASGRARQGAVKGRRSYVQIIRSQLRLSTRQMQFPKKNASVADTRIVLNALLHSHPFFKIASRCQFLIDDLLTVKTDDEGNIDKDKDKLKSHFLDNIRYLSWNYLRKWVHIQKS